MSLLKQNRGTVFIVGLLLLLTLPLLLPLFRTGFFVTDDGEWMIIRFSAFYEVLRDGQFPVRFLSRLNHGFGYPVANFLYPGFMYLGVPLHVLGFSFTDSIKAILGFSMAASIVFCYFWLRKFFSTSSSAISALLYGYAPYHLYDLYVRGSVGEILSLAVMPFVLLQSERKSLLGISIGIGMLLVSHNTLALLFMPVLFLYFALDVYIAKKRREVARLYLLSLLLGLGLSAFFWIPALYDLQYTVFSSTKVSEWRSYFASFGMIGIGALLIFIVVVGLFLSKKVDPRKHRLTIFFLVLGALSTFLASSLSTFLWNALPVSFIQFPFRMLSISIITVAFLAGSILDILTKPLRFIAVLVFFLLTAMTSFPFLSSISYFDKGDSFYSTNVDSTTVKNEYMPRWVKLKPTEIFSKKIVIENTQVEQVKIRPNQISFPLDTKAPTPVQVNTIYYPGWEVKRNQETVHVSYDNPQGVITFVARPGQAEYTVRFGETPVRMLANLISLGSIVSMMLVMSRQLLRQKIS